MHDRKYPRDLVAGDMIVLYDDRDGHYHFASSAVYAQPFWRRVTARIVETEELEGTSTESEMVERNGAQVCMLGRSNAWRVRFFIDERRYTQEVPGNLFFEVLPLHHPVCIKCVEPWPCSEHRQEQAGRRLVMELEDTCSHCGKRINGAWSTGWETDGLRYRFHTAKKYRGPDGRRCGDVARALRSGRVTDPAEGSAK